MQQQRLPMATRKSTIDHDQATALDRPDDYLS